MAKKDRLDYANLINDFDESEEAMSDVVNNPDIVKAYNEIWNNAEKTLMRIDMNKIVVYDQPFSINPSKVYALKKTIQKIGLIQPIIVRRIDEDKYQILSGHHRYTACKELNYQHVECIVVNCKNDTEAKCIVVFANIQRDQPTPLETAKLIQSLKDEKDENGEKYNNDSIAELYDISRRTVYRLEHLLELDEGLQELVDCGVVSTLSVEKINKYIDKPHQKLLRSYYDKKKKKFSQRDIDCLVRFAAKTPDFDEADLATLYEKKREKKKYKNSIYNAVAAIRKFEMTEQELDELTLKLLTEHFK